MALRNIQPDLNTNQILKFKYHLLDEANGEWLSKEVLRFSLRFETVKIDLSEIKSVKCKGLEALLESLIYLKTSDKYPELINVSSEFKLLIQILKINIFDDFIFDYSDDANTTAIAA